MASQVLNAVLTGDDNGLQDALDKVSGAARNASRQLDEVKDSIEQLEGVAAPLAQEMDGIQEEFEEGAASGKVMSQSTDSLKRDITELGGSAQGSAIFIEEFSGELIEGAAASKSMDKAINSLKDEVEQLRNSEIEASISASMLNKAMQSVSVSSQATQSSLDEVADEADDARNSFLQAAGAAEFFNLSSSALSINVGFMTVALRNATTQIPALVAGLGNLGSAFMGVAGAAGLAAAGIGGVLVGGFLAEVEGIAGELENTENSMEAMAAIGQEIRDMFIEALDPLMEMEGAAEAFRSIIEGLATTVRAFSDELARSFETDQFYGIREFMDTVGGTFMDNLADITAAMNEMFANLGPVIASILVYAIERFDDFTRFITKKTLVITDIFNQIRGELGNFIQGFIELGTVLGAALIPVLDVFFNIMSDIANVLTDVNPQALALVVQIGGLVLILNKLAGVTSTALGLFGALPAAILQSAHAASGFTDAVKIMSARMQDFISKHLKGFADLGGAIKTATAGMQNFGVSIRNASSDQLPSFLVAVGRKIESLGSKSLSFSAPSVSRSGMFPSFSSIEDKINDLGKATEDWGKDLPGSIINIGEKMRSLGGRTAITGAAISQFGDTIGKDGKSITDAFAASLGTLSNQMMATGGISATFGKVIQYMTGSLREGAGITGAMKNALAALTGSQYGASASTILWNGVLGIYNALMGAAATLTAALAVTVGALAAAFIAIAAIGGAVVLMLASIGSQGMSAEQILSSLKKSFLDIANRVMPIFMASANAINDILSALARPFRVIQNELGGSGSAFGMLQTAADALTAVMVPLFLAVGDLASAFGDHLANATRASMPIIKSLIGLFKSLMPVFSGLFQGILLITSALSKIPGHLGPVYWAMGEIADLISFLINGIATMIDGLVQLGVAAKNIAGIDTSNLETAGQSAEQQLSDEDIKREDVMSGAGILADLKQEGMAKVSPSAPTSNITYDEGDTMNNFRQDISADPEDKAQIGRIAKDAMEEANSFARKNQGGY